MPLIKLEPAWTVVQVTHVTQGQTTHLTQGQETHLMQGQVTHLTQGQTFHLTQGWKTHWHRVKEPIKCKASLKAVWESIRVTKFIEEINNTVNQKVNTAGCFKQNFPVLIHSAIRMEWPRKLCWQSLDKETKWLLRSYNWALSTVFERGTSCRSNQLEIFHIFVTLGIIDNFGENKKQL